MEWECAMRVAHVDCHGDTRSDRRLVTCEACGLHVRCAWLPRAQAGGGYRLLPRLVTDSHSFHERCFVARQSVSR